MIFVVGSTGGGGPTAADAILTVTAPAGSTVTAVKGGVTLTPTLWTAAADATQECALFVISSAQFDSSTPWTVTITNGTDTADETVIVDSNKQYYLDIDYRIWFVKHGTLVADFSPSTFATLTQASGYTSFRANSNNYARVTTQSQVDVTDYASLQLTLCLDSEDKYGASFNSTYYPSIGIGTNMPSSDTNPNYNSGKYAKLNSASGPISRNSFSVDVASSTGLKYVSFLISGWSSGTGFANIYDFYLER